MNIYTPYTYLIGWTSLDKWYYGARYAADCHPDDLWTTYFTSSPNITACRAQYGEPDVILIDQCFFTAEEALDHEKKVLTEQNASKSKIWINQTNGIGTWAAISNETRQKMSQAAKSRPPRVWTEESRRKMSKTRKGIKRTEAERLAISNGRKGISSGPQSDATKQKRSNSLKGRKRPESVCQAIREGHRKRRERLDNL